jgi:hypothetical protein
VRVRKAPNVDTVVSASKWAHSFVLPTWCEVHRCFEQASKHGITNTTDSSTISLNDERISVRSLITCEERLASTSRRSAHATRLNHDAGEATLMRLRPQRAFQVDVRNPAPHFQNTWMNTERASASEQRQRKQQQLCAYGPNHSRFEHWRCRSGTPCSIPRCGCRKASQKTNTSIKIRSGHEGRLRCKAASQWPQV